MSDFAITGVGGFVAPRHLEAIKAVGGRVVAALDPNDSVGILDKYNPECAFFTQTERFERHLYKQAALGSPVDYLVVCSPNHLHDAHIRMGLRNRCEVICEKPLVLNPENLDDLRDLSLTYDRNVNTILQLRDHPAVRELAATPLAGRRAQISVSYNTPRGRWYHQSWKGRVAESGGLWTNIGVHLFDLLHHLYGETEALHVDSANSTHVTGRLLLEHASVQWQLGISRNFSAQRTLIIDDKIVELSDGFQDAHTSQYERIMRGQGWGLSSAEAAIKTCWRIGRLVLGAPAG
jgi:UDP-N-acetyl-2-amino-2-deoxyglucuronate dehydrogenase